jgi:hypothetical protein
MMKENTLTDKLYANHDRQSLDDGNGDDNNFTAIKGHVSHSSG